MEGIAVMSDHQSPENELHDPNIAAERLAAIAAAHPELGAAVARHPKAYDGLLDWIGQYGDAAARAAVAARRAPATEPGTPAAPAAAPVIPAAHPVVPGAEPVVPTAAPIVSGTPNPDPNPYGAAQPAPRKKSKKGLTIGLIAG